MIETATQWWRGLRVFAGWLAIEPLLPGATLFALLLWLTLRYVRGGFLDVRQYAFAPNAGKWSLAAFEQRNWWSCTCDGAACRCFAGIARGWRRCCVKLLDLAAARLDPALIA